MDIQTLFALALQKQGHKTSNIRDVLDVVDLSNAKTIAQVKEAVELAGCLAFFPDEKSWNYASEIDHKNELSGVKSFSLISEDYPNHLRAIDNPPIVLHVRGNYSLLKDIRGIAVVGSRKTSKAGRIIAQRIAAQAVERDWVVVSGLALGVDAAAHEGALSVGTSGSTIAVLAHGLEQAKPASNRKLGDAILENGGAWVSEHAIGVPARPAQFVQRNRIQLGLSVGSIIIEAEEQSGSITQAKFCIQQHRPLYAVVPETPSNPLNLVSSGTQMLVDKLGANPLKSKKDYPSMFERFLHQRELMMSI
ncbi:TPA: DNA-processing protein DprA [Vibrio parahaemolyticus]